MWTQIKISNDDRTVFVKVKICWTIIKNTLQSTQRIWTAERYQGNMIFIIFDSGCATGL